MLMRITSAQSRSLLRFDMQTQVYADTYKATEQYCITFRYLSLVPPCGLEVCYWCFIRSLRLSISPRTSAILSVYVS